MRDAEKAIELDGRFYKAYYRLGCAQMALGDYRQALLNLRKALNEAPASVHNEINVALAKCEFHLARAPVTPLLMSVANSDYNVSSVAGNNNNNNNSNSNNNHINTT
uniref:Serine/threonine-protein phosphatase 5 n=1 Tax=Lygus hesperus TaxID=30085 RepID=A0A0A9WZD0_LYGHE